jgi:hypothetical protein
MSIIALALLAAAPPAEAQRLGLELAQLGSIAAMLPAIELEQTDQMLDEHPELGTRERLALRRIAHRVAIDGMERLIAAEGRGYAERMSVDDLRAAVAFARSPAGRRMHAAEPAIARTTLLAMRGFNYKREVMAALCTETGKGCASTALAATPELVCAPNDLAAVMALRAEAP